MNTLTLVEFLAVVFTALALVPAMAHVMELPNKLPMSRETYLVAFLAIGATQIIFWAITNPVNRATRNWTEAPEDWELLRDRWEISHAASAVLNFIAVVSVTIAVLRT